MISVSEKRRSRWSWPLFLLVGLGSGIGLGLGVSWGLWPVEYVDVAPDSLKPLHRQEYIVLISMAYAYDHDLELARTRLAALGDPVAAGSEVAALAERYAAQGGKDEHIQALAVLAYKLGYHRTTLAAYLPDTTPIATWTPLPTATSTATSTSTPTGTPTLVPTETPTPTPTHTATPPPAPTRQRHTATPTRTPRPTTTPTLTRVPTATPIPEPRYELVEQRRTCNDPAGKLMVRVLDVDGRQRPNVELFIRWSNGDDHFFTGLKPEMGPGYADFAMQKGETYQVEVVVKSDVAQGIVADMCEGQDRLASWRVVFQWNSETAP